MNKRILIVNDEESIFTLLVVGLKVKNYDVITAYNGSKFIEVD